MCGIAGRLLDTPGRVGADIVTMMKAMRHRGFDSTGFAFYGAGVEDGYVVRLHVEDRARLQVALADVPSRLTDAGAGLRADPTWVESPAAGDAHVRLEVAEPAGGVAVLVDALEATPGIEVQSLGRALEIVKDVGDAEEVAERHRLYDVTGTHGLGHARMATESAVKASYGHPFWARPFADVAIVHNGQLTNYYTWKRRLERLGFRFTTENDSELIAVYIARELSAGAPLQLALEQSIGELDGVFTYLLATRDAIGLAKDRFAIKPMVVCHTEDGVAMATEEQALRRIHPAEGGIESYEGPSIVQVWSSAAVREPVSA